MSPFRYPPAGSRRPGYPRRASRTNRPEGPAEDSPGQGETAGHRHLNHVAIPTPARRLPPPWVSVVRQERNRPEGPAEDSPGQGEPAGHTHLNHVAHSDTRPPAPAALGSRRASRTNRPEGPREDSPGQGEPAGHTLQTSMRRSDTRPPAPAPWVVGRVRTPIGLKRRRRIARGAQALRLYRAHALRTLNRRASGTSPPTLGALRFPSRFKNQ